MLGLFHGIGKQTRNNYGMSGSFGVTLEARVRVCLMVKMDFKLAQGMVSTRSR
jgi:hypothetical protein